MYMSAFGGNCLPTKLYSASTGGLDPAMVCHRVYMCTCARRRVCSICMVAILPDLYLRVRIYMLMYMHVCYVLGCMWLASSPGCFERID